MFRMNWKRATLEMLEKLNKEYKEVLKDDYRFTTYSAYGGHQPIIQETHGGAQTICSGYYSWKECYYSLCEAIANGWVKALVSNLRD